MGGRCLGFVLLVGWKGERRGMEDTYRGESRGKDLLVAFLVVWLLLVVDGCSFYFDGGCDGLRL